MSLAEYDWRKAASMDAVPNEEVERAFFEQAQQFIQNKSAPIMRDPYRLGFEIIEKNDDNTRMVGIFAFRINKKLFYAPAFFLNGEIKGTDLFYNQSQKSFSPNNEGWIKYYIENDKNDLGEGIDRSERSKRPHDLQLRRLAAPPITHTPGFKFASTKDEGDKKKQDKKSARFIYLAPDYVDIDRCHLTKAALAVPEVALFLTEDWDQVMGNMAKCAALRPLIKDFILQDGGWDAFEKVAHAVTDSKSFAARLCAHAEVDDFAPEELLHQTKKASTPELELVIGLMDDLNKEASESVFAKGYTFIDKRAEDKLTPVYKADGGTLSMTTVGDPGVYNILLSNGEEAKAFCAREADDGNLVYNDELIYPNSEYRLNPIRATIIFVTEDGKTGRSNTVFGDSLEGEDGFLKKEMQPGKAYRIYDPLQGVMTRTIYCSDVEDRNGVIVYTIQSSGCSPVEVLKNDDYKNTSFSQKILGESVRFVEVDVDFEKENEYSGDSIGVSNSNKHRYFDEKKIYAGGEANLNRWIYHGGMKKASVIHTNGTYCYQTEYGHPEERLEKLAMIAGLASQLGIYAGAAEDLVKEASEKGRVDFWMDTNGKSAGVIRRMSEPRFQTMNDAGFGIEVDTPQRFVLPTITEQEQPPESRVGDAYDPSMGAGPVPDTSPNHAPINLLMSGTPQQLAEFAAQDSVPHMFEHGVVGSLVQTYDSSAMIDKYLPDMRQGLDRAGRILFLFYWKPGDYQDLYGSDDMMNLENKLLSNFKSWGDLVLDLLQKTKTKNRGNVPLSGVKA